MPLISKRTRPAFLFSFAATLVGGAVVAYRLMPANDAGVSGTKEMLTAQPLDKGWQVEVHEERVVVAEAVYQPKLKELPRDAKRPHTPKLLIPPEDADRKRVEPWASMPEWAKRPWPELKLPPMPKGLTSPVNVWVSESGIKGPFYQKEVKAPVKAACSPGSHVCEFRELFSDLSQYLHIKRRVEQHRGASVKVRTQIGADLLLVAEENALAGRIMPLLVLDRSIRGNDGTPNMHNTSFGWIGVSQVLARVNFTTEARSLFLKNAGAVLKDLEQEVVYTTERNKKVRNGRVPDTGMLDTLKSFIRIVEGRTPVRSPAKASVKDWKAEVYPQ